MNWTGGSLQQSKRSGTAITAKQKAYFAKARARLHGAPQRPPSCFFDDGVGQGLHAFWAVVPGMMGKRSRNWSQRTLDTSPITPPMGSYPDSTRVWRRSRTHPPTATLQSWKGGAGLSSANKVSSIPRDGPARKLDRTAAVVPDGLVASIPIRQTGSCARVSPSIDDIEFKRRRLLQRPDWLGLATARSLKIRFPTATERQMVGRRRRLNDIDEARRKRHLQDQIRPTMTKVTPSKMVQPPRYEDEVSVRVGTSIHGSQRVPSTHPAQYGTQQHQTADEMLLSSSPHSDCSSSRLRAHSKDYVDASRNGPIFPRQLLEGQPSHGLPGERREHVQAYRGNVESPSCPSSQETTERGKSPCIHHTLMPMVDHINQAETEVQDGQRDHVQYSSQAHEDKQEVSSNHPIFSSIPSCLSLSIPRDMTVHQSKVMCSPKNAVIQTSGSREPAVSMTEQEGWRVFSNLPDSSQTRDVPGATGPNGVHYNGKLRDDQVMDSRCHSSELSIHSSQPSVVEEISNRLSPRAPRSFQICQTPHSGAVLDMIQHHVTPMRDLDVKKSTQLTDGGENARWFKFISGESKAEPLSSIGAMQHDQPLRWLPAAHLTSSRLQKTARPHPPLQASSSPDPLARPMSSPPRPSSPRFRVRARGGDRRRS